MEDARALEIKRRKCERRKKCRRIKKVKRYVLCFISLLFIFANMIKISAENTEENTEENTHTYLGEQELNKVENMVVVLDAGHGGTDVGTCVDYIEEKSINMQITNKLKETLEDKGVEVILTRMNDETIALAERTEIANSHKADLFLSIHCNFYEKDNSVSGFEAYYFNNKIAKNYADCILKELSSEEYIKTRNVKSEDYYVLKNAKEPAVLLELGFLSNEQERRNLSDDNYQNRMVEALALSIIKALQL